MHRRGVGYVAELIDADGEATELYTNDSWEDIPVKAFEPNLEVAEGSRIAWQCEYQNPEDHAVYQGPRSTDEMCMMIGSYYPRNDQIGFCARGMRGGFLNAQWDIGEGETSCADTFNGLRRG